MGVVIHNCSSFRPLALYLVRHITIGALEYKSLGLISDVDAIHGKIIKNSLTLDEEAECPIDRERFVRNVLKSQ